tara:strand:+ start:132 stop:344 length:213 start_codon:yes stop_codon:yes gene_type:complete
MSINKDFAEIVHNSLGDIDEKGDAIIFQSGDEAKIYHDQMPPLAFPFGYMIISSTFMFYDNEDENGNEEF